MQHNELEIEFKNLIDYSTFDRLRASLFEQAEMITQTNFYIDTRNFDLKNNKIALRLRDNGRSKVMTLKIPQDVGIMEYNGVIDERIIDQEYVEQQYIPNNIKLELEKFNIPCHQLKIFGALSTERREIPYFGGTLVLDASYYLDTSDYEIEYEVSNFEEGEKYFNQFLAQYNIEKVTTKSKVQRFYNHYRQLTSKIL